MSRRKRVNYDRISQKCAIVYLCLLMFALSLIVYILSDRCPVLIG